jgi:hypothetical protein
MVLLLLSLGLSAHASASGPTAVLTTDDGDRFEGTLVSQTQGHVVLEVGGIEARFDRRDIARLTLRETPEEIYRKGRLRLSDDDLSGRLGLARQMFELDALTLAQRELTRLDRDFPQQPRVTALAALVNAQQRLQSSRLSAAERDRRRDPDDRRGRRDEDPPRYLTEEQMNLIRVYEIDLSTEPRVVVPSSTLDELFERYRDSDLVPRGRRERAAFRRKAGHEQLDLLFQLRARELYGSVQVREEPEPLVRFRRNVNDPYLVRYFAPTFGQGQIDGLRLFAQRPNHENEAYTNFYLLTQFRYEGRPMIDRLAPELSLLLQWGLAREVARSPAPPVEGWEPRFASTEDPEYQRVLEWIESLYDDEPDYGISYRP